MFAGKEEEYVLYHGGLYARGKRRGIYRCNISCFGLHSLSVDHKISNWGLHWIDQWVERLPEPGKRLTILLALLKRGLTTGDSTQRFDVLRRVCYIIWPDEILDGIPEVDDIPFPIHELRRREITVINIRRQAHCTQRTIDLLERRQVDMDAMVTHHFPLAETRQAFDLVAHYRDGVMKVMITVD